MKEIFTETTEKMLKIAIYLISNVQDIYRENTEILLNDAKEHWPYRIKLSILHMLIYKCNVTPI